MGDKGPKHGKEASPKRSDEQDAPSEVRPPTPDEQKGQSIEEMENPPEAEGPRETVEEDRK